MTDATTSRRGATGARVTEATGQIRLLWIALILDAVVTGVNGLAYTAAAGPIEEHLGSEVAVLRGIGLFLLAFTAGVAAVAAFRPASTAAVGTVIVLNAIWVVGSMIAVATDSLDLTALGATWGVAQALVVGGFAAFQYTALRRI